MQVGKESELDVESLQPHHKTPADEELLHSLELDAANRVPAPSLHWDFSFSPDVTDAYLGFQANYTSRCLGVWCFLSSLIAAVRMHRVIEGKNLPNPSC